MGSTADGIAPALMSRGTPEVLIHRHEPVGHAIVVGRLEEGLHGVPVPLQPVFVKAVPQRVERILDVRGGFLKRDCGMSGRARWPGRPASSRTHIEAAAMEVETTGGRHARVALPVIEDSLGGPESI